MYIYSQYLTDYARQNFTLFMKSDVVLLNKTNSFMTNMFIVKFNSRLIISCCIAISSVCSWLYYYIAVAFKGHLIVHSYIACYRFCKYLGARVGNVTLCK